MGAFRGARGGNFDELLRAGDDRPRQLCDVAPCEGGRVQVSRGGNRLDCSRCLEQTVVGTCPAPTVAGGIGYIKRCTRWGVTRFDLAREVQEHKVITPPEGRHRCTHLSSPPWYDSQERISVAADCAADPNDSVCQLLTLTPRGLLPQTIVRDPRKPRCLDRTYWGEIFTTEIYYENELPGQETIPQAHYRGQPLEAKQFTPLYQHPLTAVPP